jgi:hypothetical protein
MRTGALALRRALYKRAELIPGVDLGGVARGALLGGSATGLLSAALARVSPRFGASGPRRWGSWRNTLRGGLAGAVGGAAMGGITGSGIFRNATNALPSGPVDPRTAGTLLSAAGATLPAVAYAYNPFLQVPEIPGEQRLGMRKLLPQVPVAYSGPQMTTAGLPTLAQHVGVDPTKLRITVDPARTTGVFPGNLLTDVNLPSAYASRHYVPQAAAAHEFGHVGQLEALRRAGGTSLLNANFLARRLGMPSLALGTMAANTDAPWALPAAIAGTVGYLPTLADEAMASHRGGLGLRDMLGGTPAQRRGNYWRAYRGMPTYLANAAIPLLTYGGHQLYRNYFG